MTDLLHVVREALKRRYALERLIGQGGMATVYLARDCRHDRPVAIKVLRPDVAASIGADRFLREIKVAAHLQHPKILALYDSGEAEGFLYYVMPFIEGESLRARLHREEQLPLSDAVQLTCEIADGLHYAHGHRVIHRDIKPENVLIQQGHALVADFGIARAVSEAGGDKLTETGMAVGTPHYMSPEQALGGEHLDGRADQYSLACVFYEMLVGQPPFDGPNARAILARHSMESVPSLRVVRHSIPDELEEVVMRALEKTPADRFPTVRDFAESLAQVDLDPRGQGVRSRGMQPSRLGSWRRLTSRSSTRMWQLVPLVILGAGLMAWFLRPDRGASPDKNRPDPRHVAVLYFRDGSQEQSLGYLADGLTEGLIRELDQVRNLEVISPRGVAMFRGDSVPRDSIARALKVGTLITGVLEPDKSRLRVTVRLVDGSSGADFERATFEQPATNLLDLKDTLIQQAAKLIRSRLGEEVRLREQRYQTQSVEAWALVQRAEHVRKRAESQAVGGSAPKGFELAFDEADSLYGLAQIADPLWEEPKLGRGWIAFRRSRLVGLDPLGARPWIERGTRFADELLGRNPTNPEALQLRGELRYWSWLLGVERNPTRAERLLDEAKTDLEAAVQVQSSQAGAWAALSHLYYQTAGEIDAKIAARRAYEEDAYLANADVILMRLFLASYDLEQFIDAAHWCDEGHRRFPVDYRFVKCMLWLMTTRGTEPNLDLAWKLADSMAKLAPPDRREFESLESRMLVAMVAARKGLRDSAAAIAKRSRGGAEIDATRDLMLDDAYVHLLAGNKAEALRSIRVFVAANPDRRASMAESPGWWFRSLQDDPEFRMIVGSKSD